MVLFAEHQFYITIYIRNDWTTRFNFLVITSVFRFWISFWIHQNCDLRLIISDTGNCESVMLVNWNRHKLSTNHSEWSLSMEIYKCWTCDGVLISSHSILVDSLLTTIIVINGGSREVQLRPCDERRAKNRLLRILLLIRVLLSSNHSPINIRWLSSMESIFYFAAQ